MKTLDNFFLRFEEKFRKAESIGNNKTAIKAARRKIFQCNSILPVKLLIQKLLFRKILELISTDKIWSNELAAFANPLLKKFKLPKMDLYFFEPYLLTGHVYKEFFEDRDVGVISSPKSDKTFKKMWYKADKEFFKHLESLGYRFVSPDGQLYPIQISISPQAKIEEVIDFINRKWKEIQKHQALYGKTHLNVAQTNYELNDFLLRKRKKMNLTDLLALVQNHYRYKKLVDNLETTTDLAKKIYNLKKGKRG